MSETSMPGDGAEQRCPVCGHVVQAEPSFPRGDAPCPRCGHLLWWIQSYVSTNSSLEEELIQLESTLEELNADSLDQVELIMQLEEEHGIAIPDDERARFRTIADLIRYLRNQDRDDDGQES